MLPNKRVSSAECHPTAEGFGCFYEGGGILIDLHIGLLAAPEMFFMLLRYDSSQLPCRVLPGISNSRVILIWKWVLHAEYCKTSMQLHKPGIILLGSIPWNSEHAR